MSKASQQHSRAPMERMKVIWAFCRDGFFPNASDIAKAMEVSTKTIHRDIEFMRDRLELPIEYDGSRSGYFAKRDARCCFCCPPSELTARYPIERKRVPMTVIRRANPGRTGNAALRQKTAEEVTLRTARHQRNLRYWRNRYHADKADGTFLHHPKLRTTPRPARRNRRTFVS